MLILVDGDPIESEALYRYDFHDGDHRFANEPPSAVIRGMTWTATDMKKEMDARQREIARPVIVPDAEKQILRNAESNIFFDPDVFDDASGNNNFHQEFKPTHPAPSNEQLATLKNNLIRSYLDFPKEKETDIRAVFVASGIPLPAEIKPINTGSRGGTTTRGGAQLKFWFQNVSDVQAILPSKSWVVDDQNNILMRDSKFGFELLKMGLPLTSYPGKTKKEEKV